MNSKRVYYGLLGLIALLLIALLAGTYGINKLLVSRAATLTSLKTKKQAFDQEQQRFVLAQKEIKKYSGLEQIAKKVVPQDKSQAEAVREIVNIAAANGISLGSVTFPPSTLGGAGQASPSGSVSPKTPSQAATATPSQAANSASNAKNKLSQLTPVTGIPGVYQLNITVASNTGNAIGYGQLIGFLNDLEHDRRTAQVNDINIQPDTKNHNSLAFTITLNEYIKP